MKPNRIAAIIVWLLSVWLTGTCINIAVEANILWSATLAILIQAILTIGERPLWRFVLRRKGGAVAIMSIAFVLIDGGLNAGGIYPMIPRLNKVPFGLMLVDAFNLSPQVDKQTAFLIAMVIGTVIGGAAEYLWEME